MVHALPLALAMVIIFPFMAYLILNDLYKKLSKWLDSKPAGNKEDEEKIIKYTIVLMVIMFIMKCVHGGGSQEEHSISPWIMYMFSVLTKLSTASVIVAMFSVVIIFWAWIFGEKTKINIKNVVIVLITSIVLTIIIPDRQTMLSMLTLSFITPDNIAVTENHIIELVTKIMDAVNNK